MTEELENIHPGEVLLEDFLIPMGISQNKLARDVSVPPRRINEIILKKRAVTADTALRLARYFGTSEKFWTGLQADYDLEEARRELADKLARISPADTSSKLSVAEAKSKYTYRTPAPAVRHATKTARSAGVTKHAATRKKVASGKSSNEAKRTTMAKKSAVKPGAKQKPR